MQIPGDNGGHFPDMSSAKAYISGEKGANTSIDYHNDRMRALKLLVSEAGSSEKLRVIDFGCGDGMYFSELFQPNGVECIFGVDVSAPMIELASLALRDYSFHGVVGGAESLQAIDEQFDIGFAIDVLGYLNEAELDIFYSEMARLIKPGGHLFVMYGNELFDMFALNSGTASFFQKHFDVDAADLLLEGGAPQYKTADRKNPLNYGAQVAKYGFNEVRQAYSQWHRVPPAIGNRNSDLADARLAMRDHGFDPNTLPPSDRWKAVFRSSIFASMLTNVGRQSGANT
jgi:SAM-dependent methyltransferase